MQHSISEDEKQHVPTKPIGCFLDYTYCGSENCKNDCCRKMSPEIRAAISKIPHALVTYSDFCGGDKSD